VEVCSPVPEVVALKVGFNVGLRYGLSNVVAVVRRLSGIPLIYDHQKGATDIPAMGESFAEVCSEAGVTAAILFPLSGLRTLETFVSALFDRHLIPVVGLSMTHGGYLQSDGGLISDDAASLICDAALKLGVTDFILPGNQPDLVRRFCQGPFMESADRPLRIMMPGIGSQGGSLEAAIRACGDHHAFAIIGSSVYAAVDPASSLAEFARELRS
jgi:orotidine-5'-phosphate decarboxylase